MGMAVPTDTAGALSLFLRHEAAGLGRGLAYDISKNLKISDT